MIGKDILSISMHHFKKLKSNKIARLGAQILGF